MACEPDRCFCSIAVVVVVIAWDHEPAFVRAVLDLNSDAWAGRIPGPRRILGGRGNFDGLRPCGAVILGMGDPDRARALRRAGGDLAFAIDAEIVREQQPERAGRFVEHRTGIAAGVVGVIPHDLRRRPTCARRRWSVSAGDRCCRNRRRRILRPSQNASSVPFAARDDRGNPVGVVSVLAGREDVDLFDRESGSDRQ